jgi:hypothetical protein
MLSPSLRNGLRIPGIDRVYPNGCLLGMVVLGGDDEEAGLRMNWSNMIGRVVVIQCVSSRLLRIEEVHVDSVEDVSNFCVLERLVFRPIIPLERGESYTMEIIFGNSK